MKRFISSFDGTKIAYDIKKYKNNFFLVFLHGAGGNYDSWKNVRNFFYKKKISTIAVDLRGQGFSQRPKKFKSYDLDNFSKDINCVLEHENVKDFALIGHCFGGMVAINYEKIFPKKAKSFILISSSYKSPKILEIFFKINPLLEIINKPFLPKNNKFNHVNYEQFIKSWDFDPKRIYLDAKSTNFFSWLRVFNTASKFNGQETLKKIKKPALIIVGDKDLIFNESISRKINELIKGSELVVAKGENHIITLNNPKIIYETTINFLQKKGFI